MRAFYCDQFVLPLPPGHRFPMDKYRLLRRRLLAEGVVSAADLRVPEDASEEEILRVHTAGYWRRLGAGELAPLEERALGFPWSPQMVERSRRSVGGTLGAARTALDETSHGGWGVAVNLAGGTHHAFAGRGAGFCVLNDVAVAIRALQAERHVERALVVDCDVHQGDGTAALFAGDPTVFTLSLHGARNFPFHKQRSSLDVAFEDGTGDGEYLAALERALEVAFAAGPHDLAVYLAGADPWRGDRLGRLGLSRGGLRRRDRLVVEACRDRGLALAIVMAGGYARSVDDIVGIHASTVREAARARAEDRRDAPSRCATADTLGAPK